MASLLVPFDGKSAGAYALDIACASAARDGDEVRIVFVVRIPYQLPISADLAAERAHAELVFARAQAMADCHGVCLDTVLATARDVGPAIVEAARGCDCIVIGKRRKRKFLARFVLDRTLRFIMAHASCQVLVAYMPDANQDATATQQFLLTPVGFGK